MSNVNYMEVKRDIERELSVNDPVSIPFRYKMMISICIEAGIDKGTDIVNMVHACDPTKGKPYIGMQLTKFPEDGNGGLLWTKVSGRYVSLI